MDSIHQARLLLAELKDLYNNYSIASKEEKNSRISQKQREIEAILQSLGSDKSVANDAAIIRGLSLNCTDEYNATAEELLSKAVKLSPNNTDCWVALGNCLWKKGDKSSAQSCFMESISQQPTVDACCEASIACRQMGGEKNAEIEESIALAKQAISLDMSNQKGWYTLGNALSAKYFSCRSGVDGDKALKAYKKAHSLPKGDTNPDLFYNRGGIYSYLLDYPRAKQDFDQSASLDGSLQPQVAAAESSMHAVIERLKRLLTLQMFANSQQISKARDELASSPLSSTGEGFASLQEGIALGKLFVAKIITKESLPKEAVHSAVPQFVLCVDAQGKFGVVALYDIGSDTSLFVPEATIAIADPDSITIDLSSASAVGAAKSVSNQCIVIRMQDRSKMRIDGLQITDVASPSEGAAVSEVY